MDFYTTVLRKSRLYWVALCLENGLLGQETTKDDAIKKIKEAIVEAISKTDLMTISQVPPLFFI